MKNILQWIWQLPQHLLALVLIRVLRVQFDIQHGICIRVLQDKHKWLSGVSLGWYILLHRDSNRNAVYHEVGHNRQSLYLGPLYLLVVGLPSLCNNLWDRLFHKKWSYVEREKWYYKRYPENWADKLGGVDRGY